MTSRLTGQRSGVPVDGEGLPRLFGHSDDAGRGSAGTPPPGPDPAPSFCSHPDGLARGAAHLLVVVEDAAAVQGQDPPAETGAGSDPPARPRAFASCGVPARRGWGVHGGGVTAQLRGGRLTECAPTLRRWRRAAVDASRGEAERT